MRKTIWMLVGVAILVLGWYLLIRPFEYVVKLKVNTLPGDIIETIRIWNTSLEGSKVVKVDSFNELKQKILWKKRRYVYDWNFKITNDTTTQVSIEITQPSRRWINKILIPFTEQPIEQDADSIAHNFYNILKTHLDITNVKLEGESKVAPSFCVCRTLETNQMYKAKGMMKEYGLLTSFIADFKLEAKGVPIVKVRDWDHSLGKLKYDFCFPITKTDSLPENEYVTYKEFKEMKVLKAVYHGNYITSDRAWYALIHFAETNNYEVNGLPIEYFYNNPNLGMDEKEWKAEIYLPIKQKSE